MIVNIAPADTNLGKVWGRPPEPGDFVHTLGDAHLYLNHVGQADLHLTREPRRLPQMKINPYVTSLFDFKYEDFEIVDYNPYPGIPAPVAV